MKIIILYGDYLTKSYERLSKFVEVAKNRNWEINYLDGGEVLNLPEKLSTPSLFQKEVLYILKDSKKIKKNDLKWLNKNFEKLPGTLVIYEEGSLGKDLITLLPKEAKKEEYKLPRLIFTFLDSFYPGNNKKCLELLHDLIKNEPIEFIFALFSRHLRDLYWVLTEEKSLKYDSWRKDKILKQAKYFKNQKEIANIINFLANADIEAKTSQTNLIDSLDLLIATKLE